jgi:hypothetical protein
MEKLKGATLLNSNLALRETLKESNMNCSRSSLRKAMGS